MKFLLPMFFSLLTCQCIQAQYLYPETKTVDSSDIYFGVKYADPYRWLEYIHQSLVENWFKDQATYTDSILNNLNGRDSLIAEWQRMDQLRPATFSSFSYEKGRLFYRKTQPGENVGKLYYRQGYSGKEILLFDPLHYIPGKTLTMEAATPSFDGKQIAIAYSEKGAEVSTIKIMDVEKKEFLTDSLYPTYGLNSWTFDNKSILYQWLKSADSKDPESRLHSKTKLHVIGSQMAADIDYFSDVTYPTLIKDPSAYPYAYVSEDAKGYIFSGSSTVQSELSFWYAPISDFSAKPINWKVLCTPADKIVRGIVMKHDDVFAITYNNAKNYKVVYASLKQQPDWNIATTIAPEKENQTVENITYCEDYLFITYSDGINNSITQFNFNTKKSSEIVLPYQGTAVVNCFNTTSNSCLIGISTWNKPYAEFQYNADTKTFSPSTFNLPPYYTATFAKLVVEEVNVKGHDGVMIPLSIIHKKDLVKNGSSVCLMDSYGAYGFSMTPFFSMREASLALKNVVIAIPHVRGGGEKGESWYRAGFKTTKPNTWKDFISCAEYLIAEGYTSANKLAGTGTSAGGILISRSITERPDLFAAAICNVGCANALRLEFGSNGPVNIPEFGTVKDSVECRALYEMDGVQHVVKGVKYPAVICVGGWNDPRVVAWEPGKFAAALQNASASGRPVLLKINYDDGHFTEDKMVTWSNFANQYTFVLWQCGHPDFQSKK
jgi:prolyl oligopeptidase